jgi:ATP-dependent Lon protease
MELPDAVPVMTLPSATLFPQALLPLYIFEPRYRRMLADTLRADRMFSVAMQQPGKQREAPCQVAGLGLIRVSVGHDDGTSHCILQGLTRVELVQTVRTKPYRIASIRALQPVPSESLVLDALVAKVHELVEERVRLAPFPFPFSAFQKAAAPGFKESKGTAKFSPREVLDYLAAIEDPDQLADLVSCAILPGAMERQIILATVNLEERLKHLVHFLMEEIRSLRKDGAP